MKTNITIKCNKCEHVFNVTPDNLLRGSGCPNCKKLTLHNIKSSNDIEFKEKANIKHNNYYNYDLVEYKNAHCYVKIGCPKHGIFTQQAQSHLNGNGCPQCAIEYTKTILSKNEEKFIEEAALIHNNYYDYSLTKYINAKTRVIVKCPIHGEFLVSPNNHLSKKRGCPKCNGSVGEKRIMLYLETNVINYDYQYKFINCKSKKELPFDFYLTEYNVCIEFDGEQHFVPKSNWGGEEALLEIQKRDQIKNEYCKNNNIELVRISYLEMDKIEEILDKIEIK